MRLFESRPALRWLAPVAVVAVVGASGLVAATAEADPKLPPRSASELLVDVQSASLDGLSGTVVQRSDLGIPAVPGAGGPSGSGGSDLTSLVAGSHTLKVWYSGPDKARLALLGRLGESDVILNGRDVWTWSSDDNAATHRRLPAGEAKQRPPQARGGVAAEVPKTPQEAAEKVLAAVEPTTEVSTDSAVTVAGREAYALVLRPKDEATLLSEVRIAVDGETHIPLQVEAFAGDRSVFDVSYTAVDFARPDDAQFAFNPPPGAKVTQVPAPTAKDQAQAKKQAAQAQKRAKAADRPTVVGQGWSTVMITKTDGGRPTGQLGAMLNSLPKVSGAWGSGRVLAGPAFTVVVTDDGRVAAGSVKPERVYEALAR